MKRGTPNVNFVRTARAIHLVALLSACATPYGGLGLLGGVEATLTSKDTYKIRAGGNSWTDVNTMKHFALLKAAETTLAANATHFEILSTTDKTEQMPVYASGVFMTMEKPGVEMVIKTHAAAGTLNAQDARQIVQTLGPKLKRKS
jgi:hypothetical protein